jgi:hypothetical protein
MVLNDAYTIFLDTYKEELKALSCYEYSSCFVFNAVPKNLANSKDASTMFDSLYSVNKSTGKIGTFKPFDMPIEEYRNGHKVATFK